MTIYQKINMLSKVIYHLGAPDEEFFLCESVREMISNPNPNPSIRIQAVFCPPWIKKEHWNAHLRMRAGKRIKPLLIKYGI